MKKDNRKLKEFLDEQVDFYNRPSFIEEDPISIPHRFTRKEDIEISGFLAATIAWGNRKIILRNANRIVELLDNSPFEFIKGADESDYSRMEGFVHRTFNSGDLIYFLKALQYIYSEKGGLESVFSTYQSTVSLQPAIHELHRIFFELTHKKSIERHVSDPEKGSAAKKINMFLRIIKVA